MNEQFLICLIIGLAGFTQGLSGFGSIILSLPVLALFMNIRTAIPFLNLLALCIGLILFFQLRHCLEWKKVFPLLVASIPGIPVGVIILKTSDPWILELILGVILVFFSLYSLFSRAPIRQINPHWVWPVGFFAGCLGGSIGANGPPVIIYTALQPWSKDTVKSTLVGYFLLTGAGVCLIQALTGLMTPEVLKLSALALPFLIAGVMLGSLCYRKMTTESYRKVVTAVLLLLGLFMLGKAL